jgi:hypothetical protein
MTKTEEMISNYTTMIQLELESIQLQMKLIKANQPGHFTLNKIIVKEAKQTIIECKERIKTWVYLNQG